MTPGEWACVFVAAVELSFVGATTINWFLIHLFLSVRSRFHDSKMPRKTPRPR
jgi:hypothetical protein